ncbi:MAG TPA: hypothetical protein VMU26_17255 [Candidatus Polarisedimenticolia bacterium]|nr:hypothetical protein [Candidatus Polarisedimenticolia bacterium]
MNVILVVLPFVIGILLKVTLFLVSGKIQKNALDQLDSESGVLTTGQKNVVLAVVGTSTASLTAASTLVSSLVTFLVVALKYQQKWIWILWGLDLALSSILWLYIRRRKEPYKRVFRLKVGTFILLLSGLLDTLGLIPTVIAARDKPAGNCVTMVVVEKTDQPT